MAATKAKKKPAAKREHQPKPSSTEAAKETPEQEESREAFGPGGTPVLLNDGRASQPDQAPKLDKAMDEVRNAYDRKRDELRFAGRTDTTFSVAGIDDPYGDGESKDAPVLSINTTDGRTFVQVDDGPEVVLDQHGTQQVMKAIASAHQAVA